MITATQFYQTSKSLPQLRKSEHIILNNFQNNFSSVQFSCSDL